MGLKQRIGALLLAVGLGLGIAVVLQSPAHAASYLHRVIHSSGLCLEVPIDPATGQGSMQMNEQLRLSVCGPSSGSWNQKFWFSDGSFSNYYFIRPGHNLWCTTPGVANLNHSTIVQWGCDWNSYSEQWIQSGPDTQGHFKLQNAASLMCLGVEGNPVVGAYVIQSTDCGSGLGSTAFWSLPYA